MERPSMFNMQFFPLKIDLNDTAQFSEDMSRNIWQNLGKIWSPNYIETFMDWIRMTQIFMDFSAIGKKKADAMKSADVMWVMNVKDIEQIHVSIIWVKAIFNP